MAQPESLYGFKKRDERKSGRQRSQNIPYEYMPRTRSSFGFILSNVDSASMFWLVTNSTCAVLFAGGLRSCRLAIVASESRGFVVANYVAVGRAERRQWIIIIITIYAVRLPHNISRWLAVKADAVRNVKIPVRHTNKISYNRWAKEIKTFGGAQNTIVSQINIIRYSMLWYYCHRKPYILSSEFEVIIIRDYQSVITYLYTALGVWF